MIYFDEDSDARFFKPEAGTMTEKDLDGMLENLGRTAVGAYIVGINAQAVNYRSKIMESYLDYFRMEAGVRQKEYSRPLSAWGYRRRANMKALEANGIDSNRYLLEGTRKLGKEAWIGIRMNDIHNGHDEEDPIHTRLWRKHPELRIPGNIPCGNGFDYSRESIRRMYSDLVLEAAQLYQPDNLLLDWLRWPLFFPAGTGREQAHLITEMLTDIRRRLGRPLACRVPLHPESALNLGLDVTTWMQNGILSHLFIGNFYNAGEFDAPVEEWRKITGSLPVIVSLEQGGWREGLHYKSLTSSPEDMRAMAAAAYWRGADGVHPFNCMPYLNSELPDEVRREKLALINDLDSPEVLYASPRRHHIGWDDNEVFLGDLDQIARVPGYFEKWILNHDLPRRSLPLKGPAEIIMHTARAPKQDADLHTDASGIRVNGHPIAKSGDYYKIPAALLKDGITEITTETDVNQLYLDFNTRF